MKFYNYKSDTSNVRRIFFLWSESSTFLHNDNSVKVYRVQKKEKLDYPSSRPCYKSVTLLFTY